MDRLVPVSITLTPEKALAVTWSDGLICNYSMPPVSYTHLRAHETVLDLVCRLLLEKKKKTKQTKTYHHYHDHAHDIDTQKKSTKITLSIFRHDRETQ